MRPARAMSMRYSETFYELFHRWSMLPMLLLGVGAATLPTWAEGPFAATDPITTLWKETLIIPAAVAMIVSIQTGDIRNIEFGWSLPNLRNRLYGGSMQIGLIAVACIAAAHLWMHSDVVAGAGVAALTYAAIATDSGGVRGSLARLIVLVLVSYYFKVSLLLRTIGTLGSIAGPACMVTAFVIMQNVRSRDRHRGRVSVTYSRDIHPAPRWVQLLSGTADFDEGRQSYRSPRSAVRGFMGWMRISLQGTSPTFRSWLAGRAFVSALFAIYMYVMNQFTFIFWPAYATFNSTSAIGTELLYPMHRKRRASIVVTMHALPIIAAFVITGVLVQTLYHVAPLTHLFGMQRSQKGDPRMATLIVCMIVWLPFALFTRTRPGWNRSHLRMQDRKLRDWFRIIWSNGVFLVGSLATTFYFEHWLPRSAILTRAAIAIGVGTCTYCALYTIMRRQYHRKDLV